MGKFLCPLSEEAIVLIFLNQRLDNVFQFGGHHSISVASNSKVNVLLKARNVW
jgi:hypothetical protein